jgi:hypothetical protein
MRQLVDLSGDLAAKSFNHRQMESFDVTLSVGSTKTQAIRDHLAILSFANVRTIRRCPLGRHHSKVKVCSGSNISSIVSLQTMAKICK